MPTQKGISRISTPHPPTTPSDINIPTIKLEYPQNLGIVVKEVIDLLNVNGLEKYSVLTVVEKTPINWNALVVRKIET